MFRKGNLWDRGVPDEWYNHQLTLGTKLKKSLPAYVGIELLIYLIIYYIINLCYKLALSAEQQRQFEDVVVFFQTGLSPLTRDITFLLGFYVSLIVKRWWDQFSNLPTPDNLAFNSTGLTYYNEEPELGEEISSNLLRYAMLSYVLCLRNISKVIAREFPSTKELESTGLATRLEIETLEAAGNIRHVWWLPLQWAMHWVKVGKQTKTIPSDSKELLREINKFYKQLQQVENYHHVPIPPIYSQVTHFAVYVYFTLAVIGNQELNSHPDIYFPIFLTLKFIFFVGWLKVAECLKNPLGDDLDDFEIGPLFSRHIWACGRHLSAGLSGPPPAPTATNGNIPEGSQQNILVAVSMDKDSADFT